MQRDFDFIRQILLRIEESSVPVDKCSLVDSSHSCEDVSFHVQLLVDNGFIELNKHKYVNDPASGVAITRLTSSGFDFLDSIRNKGVWEKVKKKLSDKSLTVAFDIIKAIAVQEALTQINT